MVQKDKREPIKEILMRQFWTAFDAFWDRSFIWDKLIQILGQIGTMK